MKNQVSIIIVNYNTEKLLSDCLKSIYSHTKDIEFEIIVVDNNSKKGSLLSVIESFPKVNFKLSDKNLGFGAANNIGACIAKGEYLFFLNPDTILLNDAVSILFKYMHEHPGVGVCGGNLYKADMSPNSSYYTTDFLTLEYNIIFNRKWLIGFNHTGNPLDVNVIVGADLFIRKSVFEQVKGFDKDFFMYFEEVELCDRVRKTGYKITSVPDAQIIHLQGASAENKGEDLNKWSYQEHWYSKFIYFSKRKGSSKTRLVYNTHMLKVNFATIIYLILRRKSKQEYWKLKKQIIKNAFDRYKNYINSKRK
ncbi:glycosyltransferase family 2 protein [Dysgonomonas sp. 216]|uniref:glycosyltransferase family 2 protein n=1 Tax=Dysgonomonas sp. 216 TaxID=2302934 RepID=UPI0013D56414|nr:glycosyltransferase family 2 protein [Dysgonomonas sp. 216]NDW17584.1 glycosyltransferase family 2 protein [Dysgonomonas sp. 216]